MTTILETGSFICFYYNVLKVVEFLETFTRWLCQSSSFVEAFTTASQLITFAVFTTIGGLNTVCKTTGMFLNKTVLYTRTYPQTVITSRRWVIFWSICCYSFSSMMLKWGGFPFVQWLKSTPLSLDSADISLQPGTGLIYIYYSYFII